MISNGRTEHPSSPPRAKPSPKDTRSCAVRCASTGPTPRGTGCRTIRSPRHVVNVLHLLLPAGERWFIDVVNKARPLVHDEELQERDQALRPAGGWHAWAHTVVLEHLAEQGHRHQAYTERLEKQWFGRVLADHPGWPKSLQRWWLNRRLAVVAAIEHYTCVLGAMGHRERGARAGRAPTRSCSTSSVGTERRRSSTGRWCSTSTTRSRAATCSGPRPWPRSVFFLSLFWVLGVQFLMRHDPSLRRRQAPVAGLAAGGPPGAAPLRRPCCTVPCLGTCAPDTTRSRRPLPRWRSTTSPGPPQRAAAQKG